MESDTPGSPQSPAQWPGTGCAGHAGQAGCWGRKGGRRQAAGGRQAGRSSSSARPERLALSFSRASPSAALLLEALAAPFGSRPVNSSAAAPLSGRFMAIKAMLHAV